MIKLTISSDFKDVRTFSKNLITIGSGLAPVDISIPDAELQPVHVKIIDEIDRVIVQNVANDPFITLNDLPFGKKTLKENDIIQIGHCHILFQTISDTQIETPLDLEELSTNKESFSPLNSIHTVQDSLFTTDETLQAETISLNISEKEKENEFSDAVEKSENFVDEAKENEFKDKEHNKNELKQSDVKKLAEPISPISPPAFQKKQLDFEVGEFDDESETWVNDKIDKIFPPIDDKLRPYVTLKFLSAVTLAILLVVALVSGALYFNKSAKIEGEELMAAEGIADIAMALKYAQIQHIKPHKKNWSDPEFIKNSLAHVIPHDYPSLANIDSQGHINHTGYSLRIYTSSDFAQFLVIAQPAPSLLQSLIPKTAIVIDSKLMQLRKVVDMKTLNRLLVNSNNLDNSNAIEVTNLVKKGELIPLSALSLKRKGNDFSPPKALSLIRPGAENFIYNSPRYYQLGESILKKAVFLMESTTNPYELSRLKQEMSMLSKMQDLVLYSTEGIDKTLEVQKAVATFAPHSKFLTAFLKFTSQGTIATSHLIIDDEHGNHFQKSEFPLTSIKTLSIVAENNLKASKEPINIALEQKEPSTLIEKLELLKLARQNSLSPIKEKIITILNEDISRPTENFDKEIYSLLQQYYEVDKEQKRLIGRAIIDYSLEYSKMPLKSFVENLSLAGLLDSSKEILDLVTEKKDIDTQIQEVLTSIETADDFIHLNNELSNALNFLTIKNFSDLDYLQFLQAEVKTKTLKIVNNWLFSSKPIPVALRYSKEQKNALKEILSSTWLEDQSDQIYYLEEFDKYNQNSN